MPKTWWLIRWKRGLGIFRVVRRACKSASRSQMFAGLTTWTISAYMMLLLATAVGRCLYIYIYNMYIDLGDFAGRLDGVQVPFVSLNHYNHPVSDGEIPWNPHNIPQWRGCGLAHGADPAGLRGFAAGAPWGGSWMIWENHRTQQGVNGLFQDMEWP